MGTFEHQPLTLFDEQPIEMRGGFLLKARAVDFGNVKKPKPEHWQAAFLYAVASEESGPLWVGDLWNWAKTNLPKELLPQLLAELGIDVNIRTLDNRGSVASKVDEEARRIAPTYSHLRVVSSLPKQDQVQLLNKAVEEGLDEIELAAVKKSHKRARVLAGRAVLEGVYRVIYADPPWKFNNKQVSGSSVNDHYPQMSVADLCKLPIQAHAEEDSVLFMWVPVPMVYDDPGPSDVIKAWGYSYREQIIWDMVMHHHSHYVSARHEVLMICVRGACTPDDPTAKPDSVQIVRRTGEHSEKPDEFRQLIQRMYTTGPYMELFGRKQTDGWDVFGNDARLWQAAS